VIDTLLDLPIVVPPPVIGLSLLIFFRTDLGHALNNLTPQWYVDGMNWALSKFLGQPIQDDKVWVYSTRGIVVAQFFVACSFGVRAVKATFDTIGPRYEDVARTLGCSRAQAFFKVVVPMARTGVVAGLVMTWARAVAEFGPVLFFSGATPYKTEVMPIAMFLRYSAGRIEPAVVLLLIMLMISTVTLLTFKRLGGRGYLW
jgi:molybdate transport system permease protein